MTCLSGSSYFFIIAVIVLLRRQFQKPEHQTEAKQPKVTEVQASAPKTPTLPSAPKVGRSDSNNTQKTIRHKTVTETVELTSLSSDGEQIDKL